MKCARSTQHAVALLGLAVASCTSAPAARAPTAQGEPETSVAAPNHATSRAAPTRAEDGRLGVPDAVAKRHAIAFRPSPSEAQLGKVMCFLTLHDAALERGEFYPLVLFEGGSVATWSQTPKGAEERFFARLSPEEQARATKLIEGIPRGRGLAEETFAPSAHVMGVSIRVGPEVETLYFDLERSPEPLQQLVTMLKQRLEAANRP